MHYKSLRQIHTFRYRVGKESLPHALSSLLIHALLAANLTLPFHCSIMLSLRSMSTLGRTAPNPTRVIGFFSSFQPRFYVVHLSPLYSLMQLVLRQSSFEPCMPRYVQRKAPLNYAGSENGSPHCRLSLPFV